MKLFCQYFIVAGIVLLGACVNNSQDPRGNNDTNEVEAGLETQTKVEKVFVEGDSVADSNNQENSNEDSPGNPAAPSEVAPDRPEYFIADININMEVPAFQDSIDLKKRELESLRMTENNLRKRALIYAGDIEKSQRINSEREEIQQQISRTETEIRELEEAQSVTQLNVKIKKFIEQKNQLLQERRMLQETVRIEVEHGQETRNSENRISVIDRKVSELNGAIRRYTDIRNEKISVAEIDRIIEGLNSQLTTLRNSESASRRNHFLMIERGAGDSEIAKAERRIREYETEISVLETKIASWEALRRRKS